MGSDERQTGSVRPLLVRDHERLEALFARLLETFLEGDPDDLRAMWTRFDLGLSAHLDAEERYLLPLFGRVDADEAAGLLAEHGVFRRSMDDLGVGVDLHAVSLEVARGFVEGLRAHAHREEQLFYRWADRLVDETGQERVARALGLAARRPGKKPAARELALR